MVGDAEVNVRRALGKCVVVVRGRRFVGWTGAPNSRLESEASAREARGQQQQGELGDDDGRRGYLQGTRKESKE